MIVRRLLDGAKRNPRKCIKIDHAYQELVVQSRWEGRIQHQFLEDREGWIRCRLAETGAGSDPTAPPLQRYLSFAKNNAYARTKNKVRPPARSDRWGRISEATGFPAGRSSGRPTLTVRSEIGPYPQGRDSALREISLDDLLRLFASQMINFEELFLVWLFEPVRQRVEFLLARRKLRHRTIGGPAQDRFDTTKKDISGPQNIAFRAVEQRAKPIDRS